jgi:hypothetical protein
MAEPTTTSATLITFASGLSAVTLALFGVDYYAILWGLVGAMFARTRADQLTLMRAVLYVALATFVGAAIGTGMQALLAQSSRPVLVLCSLAGGWGSQRLMDSLVAMIERKLDAIGASPKEGAGS